MFLSFQLLRFEILFEYLPFKCGDNGEVVITLVCGTKILGSIPSYGPYFFFYYIFMLLSSLISLPLIGAGIISFLDEKSIQKIRQVGLLSSGLTFFLSLLLWVLFDSSTAD